MNLEGRVQRLRRTVPPPCPDELAWISKLAARFDVDVPPHAAGVFAELAAMLFRDLTLDELGAARAAARPTARTSRPSPRRLPSSAAEGERRPAAQPLQAALLRPCRRARAGARVPAPGRDVELSAADAESRGIANGDTVVVRSNGTSVELRARVNRRLVEGVARVADEHAGDLHPTVEVAKT